MEEKCPANLAQGQTLIVRITFLSERESASRKGAWDIVKSWAHPTKSPSRLCDPCLIAHFNGRQIAGITEAVGRNPKPRLKFEKHAGIAARRHHPTRWGSITDFGGDKHFRARYASESVVSISQIGRPAVCFENSRRTGERFDLAPTFLAVATVTNCAHDRRADALTPHGPARA